MSLKAPFLYLPGRHVHADDNDTIDTLASSETITVDGFVGALDDSLLINQPLNNVGPVPSSSIGARADDVPGILQNKPADTGTVETMVRAAPSATTVVGAGASVELSLAYSGTISFTGPTGTLKIDNSSSFTGTITGQLAIGDVIDLADIGAGANAKISYSGNNSPGTLTVSDGTHTASIALTGNYSLANFTASSDGHGGTALVDPPVKTLAGFALDANGWPIITPPAGARIIYVSSSTGNDNNNGLSPQTAVATIAAGEALLRNNSSDELLLKAGDTWVNQSFDYLNVNGQSASAPIVIGTYGTGAAPIIETSPTTGDGIGIGSLPGKGGNNIVVEGINFYAYSRDPNNPAFAGANTTEQGTNFLNPNTWVMLVGDQFSYYSTDIIFNSSNTSAVTSSQAILYRDVVTNAWSANSHSQGLYAAGLANLDIEQSVFDHNGWNASIPGAQANIFNRNIYIQFNNNPVTFIDNISANSAAEGAEFRPGGTITGNLFVNDSDGFDLGHLEGDPVITSAVATGNVILNSTDIQSSSGLLPRSQGINVFSATGSGIQVSNNIIADASGSLVNQAGVILDSTTSGVSAANNLIYNVANPVLDSGTGNTTSPNVINGSGYLDPNRTVQTYDANVLGGPGTLADFLAKAEAQPSNPALTAAAVDAYIQAGFTLVVEQVTASPASGVELPGNTIVFSLRFGQAVNVTGTPTLTLNDGGTATYLGGTGTNAITFRYTVGATDTSVSALAITQANLPSGATITDSTGNAVNLSGALTTFAGLAVDPPTGPTISSLAESPSTGDLNAGNTVTLTLNMSGAVNVAGGTPTLTLNDGGTATYTGGSGTSALTFSYTVGSTDTNVASLAATAVNLNGATIKDGSGNAANFSLSGIVQSGPQIDTSAPTVSSVAASGTGITAGSGDLGAGSVVTLTVNLSEAVTVAGGTPTLTLNDGGTATYAGGSGTKALTFSYTVASPQNTSDLAVTAISLNGATVQDAAGNSANLSGAVTNPAGTLQIDTTTPTVSSVATSGAGITAGSGDLGAGGVVTLTMNLSEAVTVAGGTPSLILNDGGTAAYTGGSGTNALTFSYIAAAGQNTSDLAVTAVSLNGATVQNGAGTAADLSGAATNPAGTLQIDTTAPTVTQVTPSPTSGTEVPGNTLTFTLAFSEAVSVTGTPTLSLNDGGTATYTSGSGSNTLTFSYTVGSTDSAVSALAITRANLPNGATIKDGAGNAANLSAALTTFSGLATDIPPVVISVVDSAASSDLNAGKTVTLTLNLSGAVTVAGGTPTLNLNDGGMATFSGGSGTNALTFSYTVGSSDTNVASLAATAVNLNGATIKDSSGSSATLSLTGLTQTGPQIDTTPPVISTISETPSSGVLNAGKVVTYTIGMSEAVTVNTTSGVPTLTFNDGGTATYVGGSGSNALTFSYTVLQGQNTPDLQVSTFNPNGAVITDGADNAANLSVAGIAQGSPQIDTTPPTVASVAATAGDYNAGKALTLTLNMSEAVNVTGKPTLTLNDGGTASYVSGSGSSTLTFSYTVAAGQTASALAVNGISGTITDLAGNALSTSGLPQTFTGVVVDTTAPSVSSVATSGTGITAGSGDLGAGNVVTLTMNLTEPVTVAGGTPTLSLNDGGTAIYSGGSGTNALTFSYAVAAGQNIPDLTVNTLNLNGATVTDGAGNPANLSGAVTNPAGTLQIDTTTPTVSSVVTSGTGIKNGAGTVGAGAVVTLTVKLSEAVIVAGGTPTLSLNDGGTATYAGGSGTNALTFSYTALAGQSTNDLTVTAFNLNGATAKDGAGNAANLAGAITNPQGKLKIYTGAQTVLTTSTTTSGTTSLVAIGSNYALNTSGNATIIGPQLSYNGAPVTAGEFGGWTPVGAVQTATGYDIAWQLSGANQYMIWSTDDSGNYLSNLTPALAGNSTALESFETTFQQDLNGDGVIGVNSTAVETDGTTFFVQVGNQYALENNQGNGPVLKIGGAPVVLGELGPYAPVAAAQTSTGYVVALQSGSTFSIWDLDSNGNYVSDTGSLSATSLALGSYENTFQHDLNGDGHIGAVSTVIETNGTTSLVQVANEYALENNQGNGPVLKIGGAPVVVGELGSYAPVAAAQTSTGYVVALQSGSTFSIWSTDGNGNYVSDSGALSGTSLALESYESAFQHDLNGDGHIGVVSTVIEANGTTSLVQVGNEYALENNQGNGPVLKIGGAPVVVGELGSYAPVAAAQTSTGYVVALQSGSTFSIWSTDSNGNYVSDSGALSGTSTTLQSYETVFQQDLNGDGMITIPSGQSMELTGSYAGEIAFGGSTGTLKVDHAANFTGVLGGPLTPTDQIDFADVNFSSLTLGYSGNNSPGTLTVSDGTHTASFAVLGNHSLANFTASSDGHGGTIVVDPPLSAGASSGLDQQVALLSQYMASAFPSAGADDSSPVVHQSQTGDGLLAQLASAMPSQQHIGVFAG